MSVVEEALREELAETRKRKAAERVAIRAARDECASQHLLSQRARGRPMNKIEKKLVFERAYRAAMWRLGYA